MSTTALAGRPLTERALDVLRRAGNPFRNYFARNPDDEVCARYHVPELFVREREQLLSVVDLYRYAPTTHSEVVPVLGNKGSGKTHLLHSIKHGPQGPWQLLVTPGTYQKDTDFLEYLLFQVIDTLLGGGKQKTARPLEYVGELLVRGLLRNVLEALPQPQRLELFPAPGLGRWAQTWLGLGTSQALERTQWLIDNLARPVPLPFQPGGARRACEEVGLGAQRVFELVAERIHRPSSPPQGSAANAQPAPWDFGGHNTIGLMRRHIVEGMAKGVLLGDESDLASFLTFGFAELELQVRPGRQDLVLALFKALMGVLQSLHVPVVVAFDQLEDLLLARRSDDSHRTAEAFFAGIVQAMHQLDGMSFLIFAERGLWNRFVPSLDGYIQDRLNHPLHLPNHGTLQTLRLESPPADLVRRIVEARLRPALEQLPDFGELTNIFPFTPEQIERVARTEPTLRDMLQQFRHLFDHLVFGAAATEAPAASVPMDAAVTEVPPQVKSVVVVETPAAASPAAPASGSRRSLNDLWDQEVRSARRKLEPEGSLTGATRELQAGLGSFLQICHEHGVKVGPWRLQHVVPEWSFGEHPTYGALTIVHWVCKDGQPWKVGIGLFLGRGAAKPRDLGTKLAALEVEPAPIDYLILLRPEDDLALTGRSKALWQEAERHGQHARLEPASLDAFAALYAFPRVLASLTESLPEGQPLPNLADLIQEKCEKLLEQTCLPVQG
jgi:hypothetical protein